MNELVLFCRPGDDLYLGKLEADVAKAYTKMAIHDYDKLISFAPGYDASAPDHLHHAGGKVGRNLMMTVFIDQPIVRIGAVSGNFTSSSYLINPVFASEVASPKDTYLPDLDIIHLKGDSDLVKAIEEIKQFYRINGWVAETTDKTITTTDIKMLLSERLKGTRSIFTPIALRHAAARCVGYNPFYLYFDKDDKNNKDA